MWLKMQLLKRYELEKRLMGEDDDMVKKAVYLGRTLEWSENGLGGRPDRRHVRSLCCTICSWSLMQRVARLSEKAIAIQSFATFVIHEIFVLPPVPHGSLFVPT